MDFAYLDCSSGLSGDMFLAALLDAGLPKDQLTAELRKLPVGEYDFQTKRAVRGGLVATQVTIEVAGKQPERHLRDIQTLIEGSQLAATVKQKSVRVFRRLAEVEGKLHGNSPEHVHFHEVGAVDAILDIVGACVGLELLGIEALHCSPLNLGGGRVEAAHGSLPVPAPATAELLRGVPVYSTGPEAELVTPTGAVLVAELVENVGPMPHMKMERIGYGAGSRDLPGHPNLARIFLGERVAAPADPARASAREAVAASSDANGEVVSVIKANLDDMSPQLYGYFVERALAAGALDVTCSSIQMKKNRPGLEVTVMCRPELADALARLLFDETTTIGIRMHEARRKVLDREWVSVETPYGGVRIKVARRNGRVLNAAPEYEDCHRLAKEQSVSLKDVILAAQLAYARQQSGE